MNTIFFALGTRPEIIKLAPIIRRVQLANLPFSIVHTNQHYDHALDGIFFEELGLPKPDYNLQAAASRHGEMLGLMFPLFENTFTKKRPSVVVVQGDTNSAFAAAFMAKRLGIPVAHVEAGLRSDDWTMPEEMNRVLVDRISDRLYVPTAHQIKRLQQEGIADQHILLTGNPIADAVREHKEQALQTELPPVLASLLLNRFCLLTLHRPALVDHPALLVSLLQKIDAYLASHAMRACFLVHPRTRQKLPASLELSSIVLHEPVGYFAMLHLLQKATLLLTDSGGLQEEAALLHVPCITLRDNTERPETIAAGGNDLVGFDGTKLMTAMRKFLTEPVQWKPLYEIESPSDAIVADLLLHYL
ncbi:MAG: UDP-N-acetylglucosamine 2-epimerase [Candidatus Peribacteria bacterium]|nr:UDP-N-acetylglucosamine 2-epimerase [Candidatus Peribacteria bacterium]